MELPAHRFRRVACATIALATGALLTIASVGGDGSARAQAGAPSSVASPGTLGNGGFSAEGSGGGLSGITGGASSSGTPSAVAESPLYDFGTVINGVTVKHIFKIRNAGTAPLILGAVQTSCGCTAAQPTKTNIAPGEESAIAVTFDTRSDHGAATRVVTVATNDPKHQQLTLTLKGDVKVQVEADPSPLAFGNVKRGTEASKEVLISPAPGINGLTVGPIVNANRDIKVTQHPRADGKPGAALTITALGSMPAGAFTDLVKVTTNRQPLEIAVFGTVLGDIVLNPPQVSFGIVGHHASATQFVRLTNSGGRNVNVLALSSTNQAVTAAIEQITPGKEYRITLQLRSNTPDGALRGSIAIKTDDPEQQTLQVPFYGIVGSFRG
jgi:hypothetical protein